MSAVELHHVLDGPAGAPVLVLSNSLGTTTAMWEPQLAAFAERHRVLRYDHRGHGRSPTPPGPYEIADLGGDVLALLDRLGVERASFCGLSLGGMTGMWLAANAPERIERLALLCTSAHMPPAEGWAERAATVRAAGTTEVIAGAGIERWLTPAFREREPETAAWLREMLARSPAEGYAECCGVIERLDLRGQLAAIRAPTLVVAGADDPSTPLPHAELIAASVPGARLELLAPAAHMANVERPGEVAALVLEHLDSKEPDR